MDTAHSDQSFGVTWSRIPPASRKVVAWSTFCTGAHTLAWIDMEGPLHHQRSSQAFFQHKALIEPAMFAEVEFGINRSDETERLRLHREPIRASACHLT